MVADTAVSSPDPTPEPPANRRLPWVGIAAILIVSLGGVGAAYFINQHLSKEWREAQEKALAAIDAGRLDDARTLVDAWAKLDPRSTEPEYARALIEVKADRPADALTSIRSALDHGHPAEPLQILRAILLSRAEQFPEAEPILRKAFDAGSPPQAEVAEGLARIYLRTFQPALLSPVLEKWMELAPEEAKPYLWRIEVNQRIAQEVDPLIRDYREALRRSPNLDDSRLGLADRLREASKIDEASAEYDLLIARNPKNAAALIGAARVAMLKGDPPKAVEFLESAIAADPKSSTALRELALIDLRYNRFDKACQRLKQAVDLEPHDPEVRFSYSRALSAAGQTAKAAVETANTERLRKEEKEISDLRDKLSERPNDLDLRSKVARYLIEHGHAQEGLEWTSLILRVNPRHVETCRLLVDYHSKAGNAALANYYRTLLPASPAGSK